MKIGWKNFFTKLKVKDYNVTIGGAGASATAGKDISIDMDLPGDATGNVTVLVDGKPVTVSNNGNTGTSVPVKGGSNSITVSTKDNNIGEGTHNVTVIYSGDDKCAGVNSSTMVTVVPGLEETSEESKKAKIVMDFYDGTYYVVRAYGDDGVPVPAGEVIGFSINGRDYKGMSDKNGYARLLIRLNPGSYKITARYHNYMVTKTITVKQTLKLVKKNV